MTEIEYGEIVTGPRSAGAIHNDEFHGFREDYLVLHCLLRMYQPASVLEIGTNLGTGTNIICNAVPFARVESLDLPREEVSKSHQHPAHWGGSVGVKCTRPYKQLFGDSMTYDFGKYEAWFIDGEHDETHVFAEANKAIERKASLIVFHDADIEGVAAGITRAFAKHNYEVFRVKGTRIAFALRGLEDIEPRIIMPTSNKYFQFAEMSCELMDKYWPDHPPVDVLHFENAPVINLPNVRLVRIGEQAAFGWVEALASHLKTIEDRIVLLMLDDYGMFKSPNRDAIKLGIDSLLCRVEDSSFALTWQPCDPKTPAYPGFIVEFPKWAYTFNTQAALWRRGDLLRILSAVDPKVGVWSMEQTCSHWFHCVMWEEGKRMIGLDIPRPANASGFVDGTDKSGWAIAYHNLCHQGQIDRRHTDFLRSEGLL